LAVHNGLHTLADDSRLTCSPSLEEAAEGRLRGVQSLPVFFVEHACLQRQAPDRLGHLVASALHLVKEPLAGIAIGSAFPLPKSLPNCGDLALPD
jgi:hypothetical protein